MHRVDRLVIAAAAMTVAIALATYLDELAHESRNNRFFKATVAGSLARAEIEARKQAEVDAKSEEEGEAF